MATVIEIRERAVSEAEAARDIKDKADAESRGMTNEEQEQFDAHCDASDRLKREADRQERLEKLETSLNKPNDQQVAPVISEPRQSSTIIHATPEDHFRYGKLRAFKGGKDANARAYRTGKWLLATLFNNANARQWCRDHGMEMRVQTEGINTAGGFVVPSDMESAIIDLRESYGMFRQWARVLPMSTDNTTIPRRSGGLTAYFVSETDSITESDKTWNQVELTAKKLAALTRMSTDLSEDAIINMADDLASEMAYAFAAKEDACGIDGDGTSTYGGMTGIRPKMIDGTHDGAQYEAAAAGDEWSEIDVADLVGCMAKLPAYALPNAKWYCSARAKTGVFDRLAMAAGGNTTAHLAAGGQAAYSGYPIVTSAAMPTDDSSAALNAVIMLFFGDLSLSTTLGDRRGITVKVSNDRYLEYDQIGIQATERFCVVNHDLGTNTTGTSPLVGLLGNT